MVAKTVQANGLSFRVLDEGSGPAVVLLHGFPDTAALWSAQMDALTSTGFRAIAPDLRGRGGSDAPEGVDEYRMHHIIGDVAGIMDALEVERAHVVGHDWGAVAAWVLATALPDRVDKLVAVSVGHPNSRFPLSMDAIRRTFYFFIFNEPFAEELLTRDDWLIFRGWFSGQAGADAYISDLSRPGRLTAALNWYRANVPNEALLWQPRDVPPVKASTLGIFGMRDFALTEEAMLRSKDYVAGEWRYEPFQDAGHWVMRDEPDSFSRVLLDFLRS